MAKDRQKPTRTCIGTGEKKPKSEMIRLVRLEDPTGKHNFIAQVDPSGKAEGRGASIDSTIEAFDLAIKKEAISRALKLERKLGPAEISEIREAFQSVIDQRNFRQGRKKVTLKVSREDYNKATLK